MSNKKRIQKLISIKYKVPRKVTLFASYKMGWDFGYQFQDNFRKFIEEAKGFSNFDRQREIMNIPAIQPDIPGLKYHVRQLEKQIREIPIHSKAFYEKGRELRVARIELQYLAAERIKAFENDNGLIGLLRELRVPIITKHLL